MDSNPIREVAERREGRTISAQMADAEVIVLERHPLWIAAQLRRRERLEAIRRHPSYLANRGPVAQGELN